MLFQIISTSEWSISGLVVWIDAFPTNNPNVIRHQQLHRVLSDGMTGWRGGGVARISVKMWPQRCRGVSPVNAKHSANLNSMNYSWLLFAVQCHPAAWLAENYSFFLTMTSKQMELFQTFLIVLSNNCLLPAGRKRIGGGILQVPAGVARVNIENHLWQLQKCCNDQFWSPFIFGIHKKYLNYRRLLHLIINWCLILFVTNCG